MKQPREILTLETKHAPFILLTPLVLTLLLVTIFPTFYALSVSFMDFKLDSAIRTFSGFNNYLRIFVDRRFWNGFQNTLTFTLGAIFFQILIGMIIALFLNRQIFAVGVLKTIILIPMISTPVVISLLWVLLLNPQYGLLNYFFDVLNLQPQNWLGNKGQALGALILIDVWEWTPFAVLVFLAGLQSIPDEVFEAAEIDGARSHQKFLFITLPSIKPFILIVAVFRFMDAFKWFDTFAVVTKGGPGISTENWSLYGYINAFEFFDMGYSAGIGVIMLIVATIFTQTALKRIFADGQEM